jgi:hypothetical protein
MPTDGTGSPFSDERYRSAYEQTSQTCYNINTGTTKLQANTWTPFRAVQVEHTRNK